MGTPIATPSDLETFIGMAPGTIDETRATAFLLYAQDLCEAVLDPLPQTAAVVVLQVAARGFVNPTGALTETTGPYTVQRGPVALTLYKSDRTHLRRLSSSRGAFSIETLSSGTSCVQLITISGSPTGGTFLLSFFGESTIPLAYDAPADDIASALEAVPAIQSGQVAVTGTGPYTVTFQGNLATTPVPTIGADGGELTGGTEPSIAVTVVAPGVYAPGQGLYPWNYDYGVDYFDGIYSRPLA